MNLKDNPNHVDSRGKIQMILESCQIGSISRIESEAGTTRANHTHPKDSHWILINEGQIEIYEEDCRKNIIKTVLNKGDIHYTPPKTPHTMYFPCFTSFFCYSLLPRSQDNYEQETIRFDYSLRDLYNSKPRLAEQCQKANHV